MADAATLLKLTFEEGAIVINDQEEYLLDSGQDLKSVGDVVSFLEAQEKFKGKTVVPFSAKQRIIASKTGAASAVAFIKVENQQPPTMTTTPGEINDISMIFLFIVGSFTTGIAPTTCCFIGFHSSNTYTDSSTCIPPVGYNIS